MHGLADGPEARESMAGKALFLFSRTAFSEGLVERLRGLDGRLDAIWQEDPSVVVPASVPEVRVVLLDADRPGLDVVATVKRYAHACPDAPVVVFGTADPGLVERSIRAAGARAYVPKNYNDPTTVAALRLALGEVPPASSEGADRDGGMPSLKDLGLSDAESAVLALAARGKTNLEIAQALGKREGTVRIQMSAILRKLNVRNRSEAIIVAMRVIKVVQSQIDQAEHRDLDLGWLLPHMEFQRFAAGHTVFQKGDISDALYLIQRGRVLLPEIDVELHEHEMFGEIGIFAPDHRRTCSAVCATDVDAFRLTEEKVKHAYFLNPGFALFVLQAITRRLLSDGRRA
jgi:two-component system nitrate/nitrite response regulator NarL